MHFPPRTGNWVKTVAAISSGRPFNKQESRHACGGCLPNCSNWVRSSLHSCASQLIRECLAGVLISNPVLGEQSCGAVFGWPGAERSAAFHSAKLNAAVLKWAHLSPVLGLVALSMVLGISLGPYFSIFCSIYCSILFYMFTNDRLLALNKRLCVYVRWWFDIIHVSNHS